MSTSTLPTSMNAVVSTEGGDLSQAGALVDAIVPVPSPGERDLLVRLEAIAVNPIDTKQRTLGNEVEGGRILGWDAVGTVVSTGAEVALFSTGQRVFYSGAVNRPGSYAQFQAIDERLVALAPTSLSAAEAAALPLTSVTAWECLFERLPLHADSTGVLLVIGGAGGVASIAIQLAKNLTNLTVIATASRPKTREWVRNMGADHVVDHSAPDFAQQVLALAPEGVDYALSTNSAGLVDDFFAMMRPFGEIVAIDNPAELDLLPLKRKSLSWHWEFMFTKSLFAHQMQSQGRILARIAELADHATIRTTLNHTIPGVNAENLRGAHAAIESGRTIGKIVLTF